MCHQSLDVSRAVKRSSTAWKAKPRSLFQGVIFHCFGVGPILSMWSASLGLLALSKSPARLPMVAVCLARCFSGVDSVETLLLFHQGVELRDQEPYLLEVITAQILTY